MMPNTALQPTRITRYDLPMSRRLFDIAGPRGSALGRKTAVHAP
jgi:hypothetical protein